MSIRFEETADYLTCTLAVPLTINTGAFNYGCWAKRIVDQNAYANILTLAPAFGGGNFPALGFLYDTNGSDVICVYSDVPGTSYLLSTATPVDDNAWIWMVQSRSGSTGRVRLWSVSGGSTPFSDTTYTDAHDYGTLLDTVTVGNSGYVGSGPNGEVTLVKIHTGVAWSDAEAWQEAKTIPLVTPGGVDRHVISCDSISTTDRYGIREYHNPGIVLTNSGVVIGASRPSALESASFVNQRFGTG